MATYPKLNLLELSKLHSQFYSKANIPMWVKLIPQLFTTTTCKSQFCTPGMMFVSHEMVACRVHQALQVSANFINTSAICSLLLWMGWHSLVLLLYSLLAHLMFRQQQRLHQASWKHSQADVFSWKNVVPITTVTCIMLLFKTSEFSGVAHSHGFVCNDYKKTDNSKFDNSIIKDDNKSKCLWIVY